MTRRQQACATGFLWLVLTAGATAAEGIYETVPLEKTFDRELIKDSGELEDYIRRRQLRYADTDLEAYVAGIGRRLAPQPTDSYIDYRFYLFRDPSPNAFALPDGQIYVNTGMLARLDDEAQLASLLAHEINHVAGHHSIISVRADQKRGVATAVLSGLLAGVGGGWAALANLGQSAAFMLSTLGYSRDLEEEADKRGFDKLLVSGYDVRAMPEIFTILNHDPEGERPLQRTKWSTHPELQERADYLRVLAEAVPAQQLNSMVRNTADFQAQTRMIALMTVRDYTRADYPRTAIAMARNILSRHPQDAATMMAMGEAYYALGPWAELDPDVEITESEKRKNRNTRRRTRAERLSEQLETESGKENLKQNLAAAEQSFLQALAIDDSVAEAYRGLGAVYQDQGQLKDAARNYLSYLKMTPDARDRGRIVEELKSLTQDIKAESQTEETK